MKHISFRAWNYDLSQCDGFTVYSQLTFDIMTWLGTIIPTHNTIVQTNIAKLVLFNQCTLLKLLKGRPATRLVLGTAITLCQTLYKITRSESTGLCDGVDARVELNNGCLHAIRLLANNKPLPSIQSDIADSIHSTYHIKSNVDDPTFMSRWHFWLVDIAEAVERQCPNQSPEVYRWVDEIIGKDNRSIKLVDIRL